MNEQSGAPPEMEAQEKELSGRQRMAIFEAEIASFQAKVKDCEQAFRQLLEREGRGEGPFAQEMFELKQKKMEYETEIHHRKVRINWILASNGAL